MARSMGLTPTNWEAVADGEQILVGLFVAFGGVLFGYDLRLKLVGRF